MHAAARYLRLLVAFGRYSLAREMAFRGNFLVKVFVEVLWLGILLVFYRTVFSKTSMVADWNEFEYLFFVGCYFALEGLIETLFLDNCNEFSDLVRTGDLDLYLLQPIDEQFLISCRRIDWSTSANVVMGTSVMLIALYNLDWTFHAGQVALFLLLFVSGTLLAYSFLLMLTSGALWFTRNQSLFELWWLFTSLMRYPREIFAGGWAAPMGWFFSFVVPILLVINIPARVMVKLLDDPRLIAYTLGSTLLFLIVSRLFFRHALQRYRSASS